MAQPLTFDTGRKTRKVYVSVTTGIIFILLIIFPYMPVDKAVFSTRHAISHPSTSLLTSLTPGFFQFESTPAKGKFLVASRKLRDPNFLETVILLIKYDRSGTMGLVINRATNVRLSKILPDIKGLQERTDTVYLGGPVARHQMQMLIQSISQPEGSYHVFDDIYVSSSKEVLKRMIDNPGTGERFRIYAGFAGWIPGQLEREISLGSWHVLPADAGIVFDKATSEVWPELIRRSSLQYVDLFLSYVAGINLYVFFC